MVCLLSGDHQYHHLKTIPPTFYISSRDLDPFTIILMNGFIPLVLSLIGNTSLHNSCLAAVIALKPIKIPAIDGLPTGEREEIGNETVMIEREIGVIVKDLRSTTGAVCLTVNHHQKDLEVNEIPVSMEGEKNENKTQFHTLYSNMTVMPT